MRRWGLFIGFGLLMGGLILAAGWRDIATARSQLNGARESLAAVIDNPSALRETEGRASARAAIDDAASRLDAARAHVIASVPLKLSGQLPGLSRQRAGVLTLIDDASAGTQSSRRLLVAIDELGDRTALDGGAVNLSGLRDLETAMRTTGAELQRLKRGSSGLWASLAYARRRLNEVSSRVSRGLIDGADAIGAARSLMGASGHRRYLVAVQNNSEMRDQGMVLSYAALTFNAGRMTVERTGPISDLTLERPAQVSLPPATSQVFGGLRPVQLWQSVNATADWPLSASTMRAMYQQATSIDVDGVIALDVPGLAAILRIIGPVENPAGGEQITADNAGRILLHEYYAQVPRGEQGLRRERLGEVAAAVIAQLVTGRHDAIALGRELGAAAAGGHFRLWSKDEDEEKVFRRTGLGGGPAEQRPDRTFHISVQNASSTKLDYYQRQQVRMDVYLTDLGTAVVRTTLTLQNTAPKNAAPSYQLGPGGATQRKPGEYVARIYYWGPRGAAQLQAIPESGLMLNYTAGTVQPGESERFTFESVIPNAVRGGRLDLRLVPQPILVPASLQVRLHADGWSVEGAETMNLTWDRTHTVGWKVRP